MSRNGNLFVFYPFMVYKTPLSAPQDYAALNDGIITVYTQT
jgi:hypothetical protein